MLRSCSPYRILTATDRRLALLIGIGVMLMSLPALFWGLPDGKAINGGLRILDGEIPYRDFWTMYAPGQFYLVAVLFWTFGRHLMVQGIASMLLVAADAALLFVLLRRLDVPRGLAATSAALFGLSLWGPGPEISSYEPAIFFLLLGFDRVVRYAQGEGIGVLFRAGLCYGAAACFKHDVAFYMMAGSVIGAGVSWIAARPRPSAWTNPVVAAGALACGALLFVGPVIALLAWKAGPDAWEDLIVFPATEFRFVRGEGYPPLFFNLRSIWWWLNDIGNLQRGRETLRHIAMVILANLPQYVFVGGIACLMLRRQQIPPAAWMASGVALSSMPFFWLVAHVQQNTHLHSMALCSFILIGLAGRALRQNPVRRLLAAVYVAYAAGLLIHPVTQAAQAIYFWPERRPLEFPIVRGIWIPDNEYQYYAPITRFLRRHVPRDEPVYVGVTRHDAIVISNQRFYYLAERRSSSRYNELHPGYADDPEVQQEIIDAIDRRGVRCLVLWQFGWSDAVLEEKKARRRAKLPHLGAVKLDEFLWTHFEPVTKYDEYYVMWRKGISKPNGWAEKESPPVKRRARASNIAYE